MRRVISLLGMVALIAVCGCGLSEYEKQMDNERKRLVEYDQQAKYLGDPIKFVQAGKEEKKDKAAPAARVFIRPPKDIVTKAQTDGVLNIYQVAGSSPMSAPFQTFYLAVGLDQKQADFRNAVLSAFRISGSAATKEVNVQPTGETPKRFQTLQSEAKAPMGDCTLYFYFYEEAPYQVAIIYKVLKSKHSNEVEEAIKYSLRSLAVGAAAIRAEARY